MDPNYEDPDDEREQADAEGCIHTLSIYTDFVANMAGQRSDRHPEMEDNVVLIGPSRLHSLADDKSDLLNEYFRTQPGSDFEDVAIDDEPQLRRPHIPPSMRIYRAAKFLVSHELGRFADFKMRCSIMPQSNGTHSSSYIRY
jgi:hypothetical protein